MKKYPSVIGWAILSAIITGVLRFVASGECSVSAVIFAALSWIVPWVAARDIGVGTMPEVALFLLQYKGRQVPENFRIPRDYYTIGPLYFPKKLANFWGMIVLALVTPHALGFVADSVTGTANAFEKNAFGIVAESVGGSIIILMQAAFWMRHNLSYKNWRTDKNSFDEACVRLEIPEADQGEIWKQLLRVELVQED